MTEKTCRWKKLFEREGCISWLAQRREGRFTWTALKNLSKYNPSKPHKGAWSSVFRFYANLSTLWCNMNVMLRTADLTQQAHVLSNSKPKEGGRGERSEAAVIDTGWNIRTLWFRKLFLILSEVLIDSCLGCTHTRQSVPCLSMFDH